MADGSSIFGYYYFMVHDVDGKDCLLLITDGLFLFFVGYDVPTIDDQG